MRFRLLTFVFSAAVAAAPAFADDAKRPEHKITQSKSFIMVEPFYTTFYDAGRPAGLLMVAVGLDVPDEGLRGDVDRGMPTLRDDYLRNLSTFAATAVRPDRQPDIKEIADRLQRVTDRALHRAGAKVLLAQVAIRVSR